MVLGNIEFVIQCIGGTPSPACTYLFRYLILSTVSPGIIDIILWKISPPSIRTLIIIELTSVKQILNRLNLYITNCRQIKILCLVISTLAVLHNGNRIRTIGIIIEPAFCTGMCQIIMHGKISILIINRYTRIGTQHIRNSITILIPNLNTLILLMLEINILTYFDNVHTSGIPIKNMFRVQAEGKTAKVRLDHLTENTILILVADT